MKISIVVAMDKHGLMGRDNQLPWHLPADLKYFKQLTWGKPIVMGRKTYESLGKPLPGRENIVISSQNPDCFPGCRVFKSIAEVLGEIHAPELFVIGGATLFAAVLPITDRMYVTQIEAEFEGDVFFPTWNMADWHILSEERYLPSGPNQYVYTFLVLERLKPSHSSLSR